MKNNMLLVIDGILKVGKFYMCNYITICIYIYIYIHMYMYIYYNFWCPLYGTKNWILQVSFETQSSYRCVFVCFFLSVFANLPIWIHLSIWQFEFVYLNSFTVVFLTIKIKRYEINMCHMCSCLTAFA